MDIDRFCREDIGNKTQFTRSAIFQVAEWCDVIREYVNSEWKHVVKKKKYA